MRASYRLFFSMLIPFYVYAEHDGGQKSKDGKVTVAKEQSLEEECGLAMPENKELSKKELWEKTLRLAGSDKAVAFIFNRNGTPHLVYAKVGSVLKDELTGNYTVKFSDEDWIKGNSLRFSPFLSEEYGKTDEFSRSPDLKQIEQFEIRNFYGAPNDTVEISSSEVLAVMTQEDLNSKSANLAEDIVGRGSLQKVLKNWQTISDKELMAAKCVMKKLVGLSEKDSISLGVTKEGSALLGTEDSPYIQMHIKSGEKEFTVVMGNANSFTLRKEGKDGSFKDVSDTFVSRQTRDWKSLGKLMQPPLRDAVAKAVNRDKHIAAIYEIGTAEEPRYLLITGADTNALEANYLDKKGEYVSPSTIFDGAIRSTKYLRIKNQSGKEDVIELKAGFGATGIDFHESGRSPRSISVL